MTDTPEKEKPPHKHCPLECEHPQPVILADGREVCGRCLFVYHEVTEMVVCDCD